MVYSGKFGDSKNVKHVSHTDVPGGGQVVVQGNYAFIGYMAPPIGTTILDISDPSKPRIVSQIKLPKGTHSHKVRVAGDIMVVNFESLGVSTVHAGHIPMEGFEGGIKIYNISDLENPKEISFYKVGGSGVHRFDFDGKYVYLSAEVDGYLGNIVMILDLSNPVRPKEVSRWWLPGQWIAGGEKPTWYGRTHRVHHPLRSGNRLYVSYWHAGFVILDISDISKPSLVSQLGWSPPYAAPTHTVLRIPHRIMDRDFLVVTDEREVFDSPQLRESPPQPNAFVWMVDVTDERRPIPVSTYQVTTDEKFDSDVWFGAHQSQEKVYDNILCFTWFRAGLRIVDISNPYVPTEVGYYIPFPGKGEKVPQTNDVFVDEKRRIYIIDRLCGFDILEFQGD